jgi:hypothetical protein
LAWRARHPGYWRKGRGASAALHGRLEITVKMTIGFLEIVKLVTDLAFIVTAPTDWTFITWNRPAVKFHPSNASK